MPILVFTLDRSSCSRWSDLSVHLGPKRATVSRYPFYAGSVASVVRGPWARWVWTNSSKSARVGSLSSTRRVRPYRPQTNRAYSRTTRDDRVAPLLIFQDARGAARRPRQSLSP